jgi:DNA-binding GntR family transcriptional regulator
MVIPVPQTAHSYAYASLRAQILSGDLAPGTPLVQANLANALGISMTPIREALRDLATEGLVTLSPHRGAVVTSLDLADALEIHEIRLKLEPDATASAAENTTPAVLEQAEDLYQRMSTAPRAEWIALNREFHILLLSTIPSARLRSILGSLLEAAALYVGVSMRHRSGAPQDEHRELLDAFHGGDGARASAVAAKHIQATLASLRDAGAPSSAFD